MKKAIRRRALTPEVKTAFREVLDGVLPKDPELKEKIIAIYRQNPLLRSLYEEISYTVEYDDERPRN